MPLLLEILNNEMDAAKESFEEQEVSFLASTLLVRMRKEAINMTFGAKHDSCFCP